MAYKICYTYKPPGYRRPKKIKCEIPETGHVILAGKDGIDYVKVGRDVKINADIYIQADSLKRNCMCAVYFRRPYTADNDIRPLIVDGLQIIASMIRVSRDYYKSLISLGVVPIVASKICDNYDSDRIRDNIEYTRRRPYIKQSASYVLGAISRDYANESKEGRK